MWAARAAKMGYQWKVGKEMKLSFGRIIGLAIVAWLCSSGIYILLQMNTMCPLLMCGMELS
jgi:hypothetical protein